MSWCVVSSAVPQRSSRPRPSTRSLIAPAIVNPFREKLPRKGRLTWSFGLRCTKSSTLPGSTPGGTARVSTGEGRPAAFQAMGSKVTRAFAGRSVAGTSDARR